MMASVRVVRESPLPTTHIHIIVIVLLSDRFLQTKLLQHLIRRSGIAADEISGSATRGIQDFMISKQFVHFVTESLLI